MEYPKIETLYNRDEKTFKVIPGQLRMDEFGIINSWYVTEKIDGTNIRVMWDAERKRVMLGGRTDKATIPAPLLAYLQDTFPPHKFAGFDRDAILFGEGYGEKIQNGGSYRNGVSFRLFDVFCGGLWLEPEDIGGVAITMGITIAPEVATIDRLPKTYSDLLSIISRSLVALMDINNPELQAEGIVARSSPLLLTRRGQRMMWKLKFKDF